ncbi:MAG: hypothetical protein V1895_00990 [Parcubacteria group bacterium]
MGQAERSEQQQGGVRRFDKPSDDLELAYAKALGILERDAVRMADVPKDPETRKRHESRLSKKETEIASLAKSPEKMRDYKYSRVLEALVHDAVSRFGVFGKDTRSLPASKYDDLINGVDELKELEQPAAKPEYLALALDTTHGRGSGLIDKFNTIERQVHDGIQTRIDYFKSDKNPALTELDSVPRVIVGTEKKHLDELISLWLQEDRTRLEKHPVFLMILQQAVSELVVFKMINERTFKKMERDPYVEKDRKERLGRAIAAQERTGTILEKILATRLASMSAKEQVDYRYFRLTDRVDKAIKAEAGELLTGRRSPERRHP